ncbi:uncharacterized protein B0P05DRAFT_531760 [Gilbertella persicaria]|uniref:uncharacterized protein n=1 Tax=Gilbertella persicaria TaxID=101096 RepID=UPI00221F92F3|nr:uncharacterized protein B0P05DRAFT_531760 [Gilbertella persicaria]KAI8087648.1 hypothetical protein B0P05DRAFT_531760 [Gilbertella persicaria]
MVVHTQYNGKRESKKSLVADNHPRISNYFKPTPKKPAITKRKHETNENTDCNDENRKKTPSPTNSQQKKPGLGTKENTRPALRDINPSKSLNQTCHNQPTKPAFTVLSDEDIKKGVEKAVTPPIQVYCDNEEEEEVPFFVYRDTEDQSAHETRSQEDKPKEQNTQFIPETEETQWTEVTSSPIHVFDDEDEEDAQPEISASQVQEKAEYAKNGLRKKTDENADYGNNDDDDDFDDDDLFTKTTDTAITYKPIGLAEKKPLNELVSTTGSTFFDDEKDDTFVDAIHFSFGDQSDEEKGGSDFVDPDLEFSVGDIPQDDLPQVDPTLTLSPHSIEPVKEILVPYPNPRGETVLEKLNLKKMNESKAEDDLPSLS